MENERRHRPEILAPAGDAESLRAALAAGADAIYFGLDQGFNARARATNFPLEGLHETVARIHRAGARAYLALNTLVFETELRPLVGLVRAVAQAGVDALIVQDPAMALIAHALCPSLELHASTQMTVSSAEGAAFAKGLGATRIVVPRELSVEEIGRLARGTDLELEVFIHGALCVSWSGQCLTSEAWGGRSANRGQCAQSCRMPYDLVLDGATVELGDVRYLLSPKDMAGLRAVPALLDLGVHGLKIEGRQKGAAYVATAVAGYRAWVDAVARGEGEDATAQHRARADLARMTVAYTRGFSDGFLAGDDHQTLVEGRFPKHRGAYLGRVVEIAGRRVVVQRDDEGRPWTGALAQDARMGGPEGDVSSPLHGLGGSSRDASGPAAEEIAPRAGMGVVFDDGRPEEAEIGGPLFEVRAEGDLITLVFGYAGPDLRTVAPGQRVWLTSDPAVAKETRRLADAEHEPEGRWPVRLIVRGAEGTPLEVCAAGATARSEGVLTAARAGGLDEALLRGKLGAFGGTPLRLQAIDASALAPGLHLPVSELKSMRRALTEALVARIEAGPRRDVEARDVLPELRAALLAKLPARGVAVEGPTELLALCRSEAQLEAVIAAGLPEVELDFMEMVGLGRAVQRARDAGLRVTIATVRVQKPGEEGYDARIAKLRPDGVLVRHLGALMCFRAMPASERPRVHGDFSLNVTNSLTALHLLGLGLDTLTCAHDLDRVQVMELLRAAPRGRMTLALHHHIPTFHTEHCVYAHLLSRGRDHHTCGRPCEAHEVSLRDRVGHAHPVIVDVACRNTVFNAQAQSAASLVPDFLARGVRRFRVEFVRESREDAARVLTAYADLLAGRIGAPEAVRRAGVHEQFGVTRGTMSVLQ